jgi:hypothetical protein
MMNGKVKICNVLTLLRTAKLRTFAEIAFILDLRLLYWEV